MAYPDNIDEFTEKLNKLDGNTYVIEEEITLTNGMYEGDLQHDNISLPSFAIYTGKKLTGEKVENYILSTPSSTPWKKHIKVFASVEKVYVTYETQGDTVESEDINKVQESVINTQKEVDRYKSSNDVRVVNVENNKAEKIYVDTELNKRYTKDETYTKTETDQRIQMVVNAAPTALDTLKEIADALNDDPNFAATITTQLAEKVDKVTGKQLSTEDYTTTEKNKLAGIQDNANNYIHPVSHPASIITGLSKVATSNNYNDLDYKPSVPSKTSQLTNDSGFITSQDLGNIGHGDMTKSIYDTNDDGIIDKANYADSAGATNKVGNFSASGTPLTKEKLDLIAMINEVFQSVSNSLTQVNSGKDSIYSAVVGKGTTPVSKNFNDLATAISNIHVGKYDIGNILSDAQISIVQKFGDELWNNKADNLLNGADLFIDSGNNVYMNVGKAIGSSNPSNIGLVKYNNGEKIWYRKSCTCVWIDKADNIYVQVYDSTDTSYGYLVEFDKQGNILKKFSFYTPFGSALRSFQGIDMDGNVYLYDQYDLKTYKIDNSTGTEKWKIQLYGTFYFDKLGMYIVNGTTIVKLDSSTGNTILSVNLTSLTGLSGMNGIKNIVRDNAGNFYIMFANSYIAKLDSNLSNIFWVVNTLELYGGGHLYVQKATGTLYAVLEMYNYGTTSIKKYDSNGNAVWDLVRAEADLIIDTDGNLYVSELGQSSLRKLYGGATKYKIIA